MTSILSSPTSVEFGFLTADEIKQLSVAKLTNPVTFDSLGHATPNGLYDIRLGPTDVGQGLCQTCGSNFNNCPGHAGHIELKIPVYHPLLLGTLHKLLQSKCLRCHRFRLPTGEDYEYLVKMKLLEAGLLVEAESMNERLVQKSSTESETLGDREVRRANLLKHWEKMARNVVDKPPPTTHYRTAKAAAISELLSRACTAGRCGTCGAPRHKIRKSGNTKLFKSKPGKRANRTPSKSKSDFVGSDDEGDEDATTAENYDDGSTN